LREPEDRAANDERYGEEEWSENAEQGVEQNSEPRTGQDEKQSLDEIERGQDGQPYGKQGEALTAKIPRVKLKGTPEGSAKIPPKGSFLRRLMSRLKPRPTTL
jgi:hypothetical protein